MWKWLVGVIVLLVLLIVIVQSELFDVLSAVFSDFIQANE